MTSYYMKNGDKRKKPRIVVIGGGTGAFTVLAGLKKYPVRLTAIVSMADDGGSTGILREEFGILPPGDIRRALVALSRADSKLMLQLFNYRFAEGGLNGHSMGNLLLTSLDRITGSFEKAVQGASNLLRVEGAVYPVTLDNVKLMAKLEDGSIIHGETNIDIPKHDGNLEIEQLWLEPTGRIYKKAREALMQADLIVLGPGDLYTSIIPNLLVNGMAETLRMSTAKKIYVANIMTKWGETHGFTVGDFVRTMEKYLGTGVLDYVFVNTKRPGRNRLERYEKEFAEFVEMGDIPEGPRVVCRQFLRPRTFVRHDPEKIAQAIISLI